MRTGPWFSWSFAGLWLFSVAVALADPQTPPAAKRPEDGKLRIVVFGAHPDDAEIRAGGCGILWAAQGHHVKLVSVTNGDIGHTRMCGKPLAERRTAEVQAAAKVLGITAQVLDNHDGELMPTLENRRTITRVIRGWNADLVIAHRPNDYHPDHRYVGVLVQDSAFMVTVPFFCPDTPYLQNNPVFLYCYDTFQKPAPFRPDIVVSIDDVIEKKLQMLDAHTSQMYEWLPYVAGTLDQVPADPKARLDWLRKGLSRTVSEPVRQALRQWYGAQADSIRNAETFELCEYGRRPSDDELRKLFPFSRP
jgi:N-acetylglucosamine malate deacetylase 1